MRRLSTGLLFLVLGAAVLASGGSLPAADAGDPPLPAEVQQQLDALALTDVGPRRDAVYALWKLGPKAQPALPAVARALCDEDAYVRSTAAKVLARFGWQRAGNALHAVVPDLITALDDPRLDVRREAAGLLWRAGPTFAKTPPNLLAALERALVADDAQVRIRAASVLGNLSVRAKALAPVLARQLEDEDTNVRISAAQALGQIDPRGQVEALLRAFSDKQATVRTAAIGALSGLGAPIPGTGAALPAGLPPALEHALGDPVPAVRAAAANACWALLVRGAVPTLSRLLLKDEDPTVRSTAALALGGLGSPAALPALTTSTLNSNPQIRGAAALGLGQLGPEGAVALPLLRRLTEDADAGVRGNALMALGQLGAFAEPALDEILAALADKNPATRMLAASSLVQLMGAGVRDERLLPALRTATEDTDAVMRNYAYQGVRLLGRDAAGFAPVVAERLRHAEATEILLLAFVLSSIAADAPEAVLPALQSVQTEDPWQQTALWTAIARVGPKTEPGREALARLIAAVGDKAQRGGALSGLGRIGPSAAGAAAAIEPLLDDPVWRQTAAMTLLRIVDPPPENAVLVFALQLAKLKRSFIALDFSGTGTRLSALAPHLLPYLAAPSPSVRQQVATALGQIAPGDPRVRKALEQARHDEDATVRMAVALALRKAKHDSDAPLRKAKRDSDAPPRKGKGG